MTYGKMTTVHHSEHTLSAANNCCFCAHSHANSIIMIMDAIMMASIIICGMMISILIMSDMISMAVIITVMLVVLQLVMYQYTPRKRMSA